VLASVKRVAEVVIAGGLLILTAPLAALTALSVRLSSLGPVLYRQARVGRRR